MDLIAIETDAETGLDRVVRISRDNIRPLHGYLPWLTDDGVVSPSE